MWRADTVQKVNAFQAAIWYLENEFIDYQWGLLTDGLNQHAQFNEALALAFYDSVKDYEGGIGDVRVLNLTASNGRKAQDQLTMVPEPGTMILLGLTFAGAIPGLRRLRRK